jgi:molybdate transport system ATP-binding protein
VIVSVVIAMGALILSELIARRVASRVEGADAVGPSRAPFGAFTLDVAFEAPPGVTVLFGRSGVGKDQCHQCGGGAFSPDTGRIAVRDRVLFDSDAGIFTRRTSRRMGYVFQEARLFPHLTRAPEPALWARFAPEGQGASRRRRSTGSSPAGHRPAARPASARCRAASGSALPLAGRSCRGPLILLADEPLAALDASGKGNPALFRGVAGRS